MLFQLSLASLNYFLVANSANSIFLAAKTNAKSSQAMFIVLLKPETKPQHRLPNWIEMKAQTKLFLFKIQRPRH